MYLSFTIFINSRYDKQKKKKMHFFVLDIVHLCNYIYKYYL